MWKINTKTLKIGNKEAHTISTGLLYILYSFSLGTIKIDNAQRITETKYNSTKIEKSFIAIRINQLIECNKIEDNNKNSLPHVQILL